MHLRIRPLFAVLTSLLLALGLSAVAVAPASAKKKSSKTVPIRVGIGDQSPKMFGDPNYQALDMKLTRYFFPWNGMDDPYQVTLATQYLAAAKAAGVDTIIHFSTDDFRLKKGKLPSRKEYREQVEKAVPFFRDLGVKEWGVWNEANHASQPTYRNPKRAAQFFRELYQVVGKKEKIIALDVLDQGGVDKYEKTFFRSLSKTYRKRAKYIGIHNYGDVNRNRSKYTSLMIHTARKYNRNAKFWFTETGALVEFGKSFKCSTGRASSRMKNVFKLAKKYRRFGVQRVLLYNWQGPGCGNARFDAGLVGPDGTPRKTYYRLKKEIKNYKR